MQISDDELLGLYPDRFRTMTAACRGRYSNFKENDVFGEHLRTMKANPTITRERYLDPSRPQSSSTYLYNIDAVFQYLDEFYEVRTDQRAS